MPSLFIDDGKGSANISPHNNHIFSTLNKQEIHEIFGSEGNINTEVNMSVDGGFTGLYPFDSYQNKVNSTRNWAQSSQAPNHQTIQSIDHSLSMVNGSQETNIKIRGHNQSIRDARKKHGHSMSMYTKIKTPRIAKMDHTCFI